MEISFSTIDKIKEKCVKMIDQKTELKINVSSLFI